MSLKVENLEKNMIKLTIEVEASELEKAIDKAYQKQKNQINIPGFRKGKAPRKMIEKMYGAGIFYEDAANALIPEAYSKALDEYEGTEIVSAPSIDVVQLEAGKPFIFTAEVAVKPEVTLGQYKGLEIDKVEATVSEEVSAATTTFFSATSSLVSSGSGIPFSLRKIFINSLPVMVSFSIRNSANLSISSRFSLKRFRAVA